MEDLSEEIEKEALEKESRLIRVEKRKTEWETRRICSGLVEEVVLGLDSFIATETVKEVFEKVPEAVEQEMMSIRRLRRSCQVV